MSPTLAGLVVLTAALAITPALAVRHSFWHADVSRCGCEVAASLDIRKFDTSPTIPIKSFAAFAKAPMHSMRRCKYSLVCSLFVVNEQLFLAVSRVVFGSVLLRKASHQPLNT